MVIHPLGCGVYSLLKKRKVFSGAKKRKTLSFWKRVMFSLVGNHFLGKWFLKVYQTQESPGKWFLFNKQGQFSFLMLPSLLSQTSPCFGYRCWKHDKAKGHARKRSKILKCILICQCLKH